MFVYCNGGYVVLAILAERATGTPFHELVAERVCSPAGLSRTEYLRADELPGEVAVGYVTMDGVERSNIFHLPLRGSGDGGIATTLDDVSAFWRALDAGVSFRSVHDRERRLGHTVIGNTTDGAWPVSRLLGDALGTR
jgi:CubicO group peptidase (beta-lactamase class C family)